MLRFYPHRWASPPAVEEVSAGAQCHSQGALRGQDAVRNQSVGHGKMTLTLSAKFPLTYTGVDTRTGTHGPVQLLFEYGSDTYRLARAREYWAPSYL